ncbi:MAG: hypothetical protein AAFA34_01595 [Thermoplasmata archaeon]|jgi:hypothetical protein
MALANGVGIEIGLPERIDRPLKLGPFPSARDAVKGLGYGLGGALLIPFVGLWGWLPMIGVGLLVGLVRIDGVPIDTGLYLRARRRLRREERLLRRRLPADGAEEDRYLTLPMGRRVGIVQAEGTPLAFLPPAELRTRFDLFRELLVDCGAGGVLIASTLPIAPQSLRPRRPGLEGREAVVRDSYGELIDRLCERRRHRRSYLALWTAEAGPEPLARLEGRLAAVEERFRALGACPRRLTGRELTRAARRFGWERPVAPGGAP